MMSRRHLVHRIGTSLAALLLVATVTTACEPDPSQTVAQAQDAVERYVATVANGELTGASALTDPRALVPPHRSGEQLVDVTEALPNAEHSFQDPWVNFLNHGFVDLPATDGRTADEVEAIWFQVSYRLGPGTGSDKVAVAPDNKGGWTVVDGLLRDVEVSTPGHDLSAFTVGGVRVGVDGASTIVWGYPGSYLAEGAEVSKGYSVQPITLHIGAEIDPDWDDRSSTMLEAERTDTEDG